MEREPLHGIDPGSTSAAFVRGADAALGRTVLVALVGLAVFALVASGATFA